MQRDYRFDNLKLVLMFLVVFGHLLELISGAFRLELYRVIYSFHMPAFIFVSGYFARFKPRKILLRLIWPYMLFQTLYTLFNSALFDSAFTLQFTTPYWLMWYLMVMVFYYCLIPLFDTNSTKMRILIVGLSVFASLAAGYDDSIGRFLSLSRFFTFLPYFLIGFYLGKTETIAHIESLPANRRMAIKGASLALAIGAMVCVLLLPQISPTVLYGASSYGSGAYGPKLKILLLGIAACWICFLVLISPVRKIPILTAVGANTLSIYILHGFIVKYLSTQELFVFGSAANILLALLISAVIVLLLGSNPVAKAFNFCCTGAWLERLLRTIKNRF